MKKILETELSSGDRVFSIGFPRIYLGVVTSVFPNLFYAVDSAGLETGYVISKTRTILVEK